MPVDLALGRLPPRRDGGVWRRFRGARARDARRGGRAERRLPSGRFPALHGAHRRILVGTEERRYLIDAPAGPGDVPRPVVFAFHAFQESARRQRTLSGLGPLAQREGFIAITPEGRDTLPLGGQVGRGWRPGPGETGDVTFVRTLLDALERDRCVDRRRVFATGLANGGVFANLLGCVLGDRLAAVAPVAGAAPLDGCVPAQAMPVLLLGGGEEGGADAGAWWRRANGCGPPVAEQNRCVHATACAAEVVSCPAAPEPAWPPGASERLWRFFRAHSRPEPPGAGPPEPLAVGPGERLLVVAPHPDDETLGAAGLMQRVLAHGGAVRVVLLTAGDGYVEAVEHETRQPRPRPEAFVDYGERRLREARAALRVLGGPRLRFTLFGFPDGGLEPLLTRYWRRLHPERSPTTGVTAPPYGPEALGPDVPYDGADLRAEIVRLLLTVDPTIVVFPDPLDRHPDHRAAGLFTLLALTDWRGTHAPLPRLFAYLVHWPDWPPGWGAPAGTTNQPLLLPAPLPARVLARVALALTETEVATKQAALARYETQQREMAPLLAAFARRTEPFTVFTVQELRRVGPVIAHERR